MDKFISTVLIFFGSIVKFSVGSFAAMTAELGIEGPVANVIGGIIGIVLFTYFGNFVQDFLLKKYPNLFGKKFTRSSRFLVNVKQKFGLGGIAALTPIVLSIPVGVIFALALTHDKKKIMVSMILSLFFWATVLFLPYYLFDISVLDLVKRIFE